MAEYLDFTPFPGLHWSMVQTGFAATPTLVKAPKSTTKLVPLQDGDKIACEDSVPEQWKADDPMVLTLHGLCGDHTSPYQIRLTRNLYDLGFRVVRMNLRGCGSGVPYAKHPYHAGQSDDLFEVVKWLKNEWPQADLHLVGFSLGGGVAVKLAGELGASGKDYVKQTIAICPSLNFANCSRRISQPSNWIYERLFVHWRLQEVARQQRHFPELQDPGLSWMSSMKEFDEYYTAPRSGFHNADDYFLRASPDLVMESIDVPTIILFSDDDPIIDPTILDHRQLPDCVQIYRTRNGGHVGFFGHPFRTGGMRWLDKQVLQWVTASYDGLTQPLENARNEPATLLGRFVSTMLQNNFTKGS